MPVVPTRPYILKSLSFLLIPIRGLFDFFISQVSYFSYGDNEKKLMKSGYVLLDLSRFFDRAEHERLKKDVVELLDSLETKRREFPADCPIEDANENSEYAFLNEIPFYCERLGPRLRISFTTNQFSDWPELARKVVFSKEYVGLMNSVCKTKSGIYKCYIEKTFLGGPSPQWHIDSISKMLRLQIYLSDVDQNAAPMEYIPESQSDFSIPFLSMRIDQHFKSESWTKNLERVDSSKIVSLLGKSGSCYLFDSRGVHRSTGSTSSHRYSMMITFTPDNFFNRIFEHFRGGWKKSASPE